MLMMFLFFFLPFFKNLKIRYNTSLYQHACVEDEEMCLIETVDNYNKTVNYDSLKKYLTDEVLNDYEECILTANDGCETFWYIDDNYTQWKIENGSVSYLDKTPFRWVYVNRED